MPSRTAHDQGTLTAGSVGLAALLLYGGMALERAQMTATQAALPILLTLVGAWLAIWGLSRLHDDTRARWSVLLLTGLLPIATFVGWAVTGNAEGLLLGVLWLNLAAGVVTTLLVGWRMATTRQHAGGRGRIARA